MNNVQISMQNVLLNEVRKSQPINHTQLIELESLFDSLDFNLSALPYDSVPDRLRRLTNPNNMNLRTQFLMSRCYADAFGFAASYAKKYILLNPKQKDNEGTWKRSDNSKVPEVDEFMTSFGKTAKYWATYLDTQEAQDQLENGIVGALDNVMMEKDSHWHTVASVIIDRFNDLEGHYSKSKTATDNIIHKFYTKQVTDYKVARHHLENVQADLALQQIIETSAGMSLESIEEMINFNIKELSDYLEGWEVSDVEEEGKELLDITKLDEVRSESDYTEEVIHSLEPAEVDETLSLK